MFTYNGEPSSDYVDVVKDIRKTILPPSSDRLLRVPGRPGAFDFGRDIDVLEIEVDILIQGDSLSDLRKRVRDLASWLNQDDVKELIFDNEPDITYYARISGDTDLSEVLEIGEATLTFVCPDPYGYGEEKIEEIQTGSVSNTEETQADWEDPDAILTDVEANSNDQLVLVKEGSDYLGAVDTAWDGGTHNNTEEVNNDYLELQKTGSDTTIQENTSTDWGNGSNNSGLRITGDVLEIDLPDWDHKDRFANMDNWGVTEGTGGIDHDPDAQEVTLSVNDTTSKIYIRNQDNWPMGPAPMTVDFKAKIDNDGARPFIFVGNNDDGAGLDIPLPDTAGAWSWFRVIVEAIGSDVVSSTFYLYQDGTDVTPSSDVHLFGTSYDLITLGIDPGGPCTFTITKLGEKDADHGAPPSNHEYTGERNSPEFDISAVDTYVTSTFRRILANTTAGDIHDEDYDVNFYSQVSTDGGTNYTAEAAINDGDPIPDLSKGDDVSQGRWKYRLEMKSRDSIDSVQLEETDTDFVSGYHSSGDWISPTIDISQVVKAGETQFTWENNDLPSNTTVRVYTRVSYDGGTNWEPWREVANSGDPVPDIGQNTDLSDARFEHKFELETTDIAVTPSVDRADYDFYTGYKPEGNRVAPPVDVGSIGIAGESLISWDPDDGNITIETQLVDAGSSPDSGSWLEAENNGSIPGIVSGTTDLTGKELYVRQKLKTDDTSTTPKLNRVKWSISPDSFVTYDGTAKAYPTITATFNENTDSFQITHLETGDFILVEYDFSTGDELEIDCESNTIRINGTIRLKYLHRDSTFFPLRKGENSFDADPAGTDIEIKWRERWV